MQGTADIFWSREPITGPKGTKENPAIIPSFNDHRVVGLEIEQARGVPLFRLRVRLRCVLCISCCTHSCGQNHRRAALTTRPSLLPAGRHLVQAGGGAAALRRGAVLQVRAPAPHMLPMSTPRLAWPPTVKLSGAATHAVNLPLAGCSEWRVASTSFTHLAEDARRRSPAGEGWFTGTMEEGRAQPPLAPPRRVGKGYLSEPSLLLLVIRCAPEVFSFLTMSFRVRRR